jgi:D-glycero-alpha-D-manno-heptose-7-phosphate kinase
MIISRSPLRISLGGGGTDLPSYYREHEGFLIASAIDKYVYISVHRSFNKEIILRYSKLEHVADMFQIQHPIIREALKLLNISDRNIEITSMADIPAGTGLGSSGSFTTCLLKALYRLRNHSITQNKLAELACQIEIDILKEPIGKQDQYAAAMGGINCYEFKKDNSVIVQPLMIADETLQRFYNHILIFSTGVSRNASQILLSQDQKTKAGSSEMIDNLHYCKELGVMSKKMLETGDLESYGHLLDQHWQHKKKRSNQMSSSDIDRWYAIATKKGSALGGKLIGAGGGGFLMFYATDPTLLRNVLEPEGLVELKYGIDYEGTKILS